MADIVFNLQTPEEQQWYLQQLHALHTRTLHIRLQTLNDFDTGNHHQQYIAGLVTGGSITVSGASSMRRTGSLSMVADGRIYRITDVNNLISINKTIKIQVGLALGVDIIWFALGTYVITNASIVHDVQKISININIKDLMARLNGECGGVLQTGLIHSPDQDGNPVPMLDLLAALLSTYTNIDLDTAEIDLKGKNSSLISITHNGKEKLYLKQTATWTSSTPIYIVKESDITIGEDELIVYKLTSEEPAEGLTADAYSFQDNIGYKLTEYTYPAQDELSNTAGETVVSLLDKIKGVCGNFEYFFDVNGKFYFREIKNGINQGSDKLNLTDAIADRYLVTKDDDDECAYRFDDLGLVVSTSNNPQYSAIKNDLIIWGQRQDNKQALCYHLLIDKTPTWNANMSFGCEVYTDSWGVKRAKPISSVANAQSITPKDWRQFLYLDYVINGNERYQIGEELKENLPKIMDIEDGTFFVSEDSNRKALNSISYFIDMLDPTDSAFNNNPVAQKALQGMMISKIGQRGRTFSDDKVNTVFNPSFTDVVYIKVGTATTGLERQIAMQQKFDFIQASATVAQYIAENAAQYSAFDYIRSMLHEVLNFNNVITLSTIPIYSLDVNQKIYVKDAQADVDGEYIINSLTIPLTADGKMTINAQQAVHRI